MTRRENRHEDELDGQTKDRLMALHDHFSFLLQENDQVMPHLKEIDVLATNLLVNLANSSTCEKLCLIDHTPKIQTTATDNDGIKSLTRSRTNSNRQSFLSAPLDLRNSIFGKDRKRDSLNLTPPILIQSAQPQQPKAFGKLPKEILDANLPKPELMRLSTVYELIETEADYVRDLQTMIQVLKIDLVASSSIKGKQALE